MRKMARRFLECMRVVFGERETHIEKLRVVSDERDALSLRLRITSALSVADMGPALPRSAVAYIRKLRDPHPRLLKFGSGDTPVSRAWERKVAESVGHLL